LKPELDDGRNLQGRVGLAILYLRTLCLAVLFICTLQPIARAQQLPATRAELLTGGSVLVSELLAGRPAVLIGSFSRASNEASAEWLRESSSNPILAHLSVYQLIFLERAPGFVRTLIRASLKRQNKGVDLGRVLILTRDEGLWRSMFAVKDETQPQIVVFNAKGQCVARMSGSLAANRAALNAVLALLLAPGH